MTGTGNKGAGLGPGGAQEMVERRDRTGTAGGGALALGEEPVEVGHHSGKDKI